MCIVLLIIYHLREAMSSRLAAPQAEIEALWSLGETAESVAKWVITDDPAVEISTPTLNKNALEFHPRGQNPGAADFIPSRKMQPMPAPANQPPSYEEAISQLRMHNPPAPKPAYRPMPVPMPVPIPVPMPTPSYAYARAPVQMPPYYQQPQPQQHQPPQQQNPAPRRRSKQPKRVVQRTGDVMSSGTGSDLVITIKCKPTGRR